MLGPNVSVIRRFHCTFTPRCVFLYPCALLCSYLQRPSSGGNGSGGHSGSLRKTTGSIRSTPRSTSQWRRATATRQTVSGKNTVSEGGCEGGREGGSGGGRE